MNYTKRPDRIKRARAGENDLFFIKCAIIFLIVVLVAVL